FVHAPKHCIVFFGLFLGHNLSSFILSFGKRFSTRRVISPSTRRARKLSPRVKSRMDRSAFLRTTNWVHPFFNQGLGSFSARTCSAFKSCISTLARLRPTPNPIACCNFCRCSILLPSCCKHCCRILLSCRKRICSLAFRLLAATRCKSC